MDVQEYTKRVNLFCEAAKEYYTAARNHAPDEIQKREHAGQKRNELKPFLTDMPKEAKFAIDDIEAHWSGDRAHYMNVAQEVLNSLLFKECEICKTPFIPSTIKKKQCSICSSGPVKKERCLDNKVLSQIKKGRSK